MSEPPENDGPVLRVVRGRPTPEEVAALVAVLSARAAAGASVRTGPRRTWNDPARLVRTPVQAGQGGWRASAVPR